MQEYKLIRSRRKTIGLEVNSDLKLVVRAPVKASVSEIEKIIQTDAAWIEQAKARQMRRRENTVVLSEEEINRLKKLARDVIPKRVEYFGKIMGLTPSSVKITSARTRFGSCNGRDRLCFSYIVMCYEPECIDYVVVHELAHIKHHNHSAAFYALVEKYMPNYKTCQKRLRERVIK